jgi:hypothetical protein
MAIDADKVASDFDIISGAEKNGVANMCYR